MAGLFIIIIGITTFFELKDDKKGDVVFFGCMKVLLAIIALLLIGRAVFLIITAAAISARKKRCTEAVLAELTGLTVSPLDPDSGGDEESNFIYIYNYEGNDYRLIVDGFTTGIERTGELELSVDPQQPELCYYRQIQRGKNKKTDLPDHFPAAFFISYVGSHAADEVLLNINIKTLRRV